MGDPVNQYSELSGRHLDFQKRQGSREYAFTLISEGQTNDFSAHLFKLEGHLFFDFLSLKQTSLGLMHAHILLEVTQTQPTLKTSFMNHEWLVKLLEQEPKAIRRAVPWIVPTARAARTTNGLF